MTAEPDTTRVTELLADGGGGAGRRRAQRSGRDGRGRRARFRAPASTSPCRPAPAPASRWPTWCRRSRTPSTTNRPGRRLDRDHRPAASARRPRPAAAGRRADRDAAPPARVRAAEGARKLPVPQQDPQRLDRRLPNPTTGRRRSCSTPSRPARWGATCSGSSSGRRDTETGDRDELIPGVPDRSWSQVSVSARECIGVSRCPFGTDCFAEQARDRAGHADVVVTNHALLAIDAIADANVLPEHDLLVVDEAHELVDRVTGVATAELSATSLGVAQRRAAPPRRTRTRRAVRGGGRRRSPRRSSTPDAGRIDVLDDEMAHLPDGAARRRDRARSRDRHRPQRPEGRGRAHRGGHVAGRCQRHRVTDPRLVRARRSPTAPTSCGSNTRNIPAGRRKSHACCGWPRCRWQACCAPGCSAVDGRADLGDTDHRRHLRRDGPAWGLDRSDDPTPRSRGAGSTSARRSTTRNRASSTSPRTCRPPGRDGTGSAEQLDEIAELIAAAGGRTLGLFSSMRAAKAAAEVDARTPRHPGAVPGRRHHRGAGPTLRRRRADIACSARCRCGRASTFPARRCPWCSSTGSRSRAPTIRC